ncbi:hypothetical protein AVEN_200624-1 [Araneus ventricosus]|uniref:Tc1-like transposase DDE domain-containing protein n=1 Tax=Araneus ventricosus TaxID=182803 RepID=A0A4Y2SGF5_ARAVE|nr:hypothetical protein AVEN_200624-1 [Araneus ventricosus]
MTLNIQSPDKKISHPSAQAQMNRMCPLTAVTTNMNQHVCFNLLDDQVLPFSQHLHYEYALVAFIFQDDNSTVHRADWFDDYCIDWPAKSPDLNPIENLWDMLEQLVKRRNHHHRNLVDLSEWKSGCDVPAKPCGLASQPNTGGYYNLRPLFVIKSRGGVTRY